MKIKFIYHTIIAISLLMVSACDTWDEDINKDPMSPPYAIDENEQDGGLGYSPELFMPDMLFSVVDGWDYIHWNVAAAVCEYHGKTKSLSQGNRHKSWHALEYLWEPAYKSVKIVKNLRNAAIDQNDTRYQAIADIWECYNFFGLTLLYGDVPYSQSIIDDAPLKPAYDKQADLYPVLLNKLINAGLMISLSDAPVDVASDAIFQGNTQQWKKLANTLAVRYAMYMSDAAPDSAKAILNKIVNNPDVYPLMESNDDNAYYHYDGNQRTSWVYRLSKAKIEEAPFSNIFIERLISLKDPRLPVYARPVQKQHTNADCFSLPSNNGTDKYAGHIYGITTDNAHAVIWNGGPLYASKLGTYFRTENQDGEATQECATLPFYIALYAELQFFLAEAREKGFITTGTAREYYENAIEASFTQYETSFSTNAYKNAFGSNALVSISDYLQQKDVDYNGGRNKLLLIAEQKWIASFMLNFEAYFEKRRTMLPPLRASSGAEDFAYSGSGSKFPSRAAYPDSEASENEANYDNARATGFDIPIVNDESRNEALMWVLADKGQDWLKLKVIQEPKHPSEYPCVENKPEYGTQYKQWYSENWDTFFWWKNNDK